MKEQKFILYWNGTSETLTINPDGWAQNGQRWQRDRVYYGVFQTYTVQEFRFSTKSGGGGDFILNAYDTDDILADITVEVYNRNPQTNDYDLSYTGKLNIDPDKFTHDPTARFIDVGFVQNSNVQKFITRDELELNIKDTESVDGVEMLASTNPATDITFPGVDLFREAEVNGNYDYEYYYANVTSPAGNTPPGDRVEPSAEVRIKYYAETIIKNELGDDLSSIAGPTYVNRSPYLYINNNDFETEITVSQAGTFPLSVRVEFQDFGAVVSPRITMQLLYYVFDSDSNIIDSNVFESVTWDLYSTGSIQINGFDIYEFDFSVIEGETITVPSGGSLFIGVSTVSENISPTFDTQFIAVRSFGDINFELIEESAASDSAAIECYSPIGVFKRIFQLITSNENTFVSTFFDSLGAGQYTYLTNGFNIRGFPNRAIPVTAKDTFQSYGSLYNLGLSYDQVNSRFYIEEVEEFFDAENVMFDLGEVEELRIKPFKDAYFNEYHGGNENDGEYENVQGVNEFNVESSWSTGMPIKEKFLRRCTYYTDTVAIELARRKPYVTHASEDTDYDDRVYLIDTFMGAAKQNFPRAAGFAGIEQYYNVGFAPRNNLLRHANWIKAMFWKDPDFEIRFRKSKKGVNITYTSALGNTVSEFDSITAAELDSVVRLFNPQYYELKGRFMAEYRDALQENPHGVIRFSHFGTNYSGFVDEVQTRDYERQADYKLIASNTAAGALKEFTDDSLAEFTDDSLHELI